MEQRKEILQEFNSLRQNPFRMEGNECDKLNLYLTTRSVQNRYRECGKGLLHPLKDLEKTKQINKIFYRLKI